MHASMHTTCFHRLLLQPHVPHLTLCHSGFFVSAFDRLCSLRLWCAKCAHPLLHRLLLIFLQLPDDKGNLKLPDIVDAAKYLAQEQGLQVVRPGFLSPTSMGLVSLIKWARHTIHRGAEGGALMFVSNP